MRLTPALRNVRSNKAVTAIEYALIAAIIAAAIVAATPLFRELGVPFARLAQTLASL